MDRIAEGLLCEGRYQEGRERRAQSDCPEGAAESHPASAYNGRVVGGVPERPGCGQVLQEDIQLAAQAVPFLAGGERGLERLKSREFDESTSTPTVG